MSTFYQTNVFSKIFISACFHNSKFIENHNHHQIAPQARISLTLFPHPSLLFIALGRSSKLHPVSVQGCYWYVLADWPTLARPCVGVLVIYWPSARANMPFQSDAPEGIDTFQWPVIERNRVGGFGWWNGTR